VTQASETVTREDEAPPTEDGRRDYSIPLLARQLIPGLVLLVLAVRTLGALNDPDTWWHLRSGHDVLGGGDFVGPDRWDTLATGEWVRHQWLGEVVIAAADSIGGLGAVAFLRPVATVALGAAILWSTRSRTSIIPSTLIATAAVTATFGSLSLRPQLISFVLMAVFAGAWMNSADDLRPRWWLVPLTWIWACSHGFWFMGPAIGVVVILGLALERTPWRDLRRLALVPLAGLVVAGLTPILWHVYTAPFQVSEITKFIQEWAPTSVTDPPAIAALALIAVPVVIGLRHPRRTRWVEVLVILVAVVLTLRYSRTIALAGPIIAPVAAASLERVLPLRRERFTRRELTLTSVLAGIGLLVAGIQAPSVGHSLGFPERLSAQLSELPAGTVVCNDYKLGGWLVYSHPDLVPSIEGRSELYPPQFIRSWQEWVSGYPEWREFQESVDCGAALLQTESPMPGILENELGWTTAGRDEGYTLLVPGSTQG
jgi:hypothetical protein